MEWHEVEKRAAGIFASDIDTEITPTSPITNTATVEMPLVSTDTATTDTAQDTAEIPYGTTDATQFTTADSRSSTAEIPTVEPTNNPIEYEGAHVLQEAQVTNKMQKTLLTFT